MPLSLSLALCLTSRLPSPLCLPSPQEYPLAPLEDDCKLLGSLLDDCLRIEVGDDLFAKVMWT